MATILVVDSEKDVLNSIKSILVKAGHRVAVSTDGNHAVELAENEPFDLLLIDLQNTDIDDSKAIHRIRYIDNNIAIIAMYEDEYTETPPNQKMTNLDIIDATIRKPINQTNLLNTVDQILKQ